MVLIEKYTIFLKIIKMRLKNNLRKAFSFKISITLNIYLLP